MANIAPALRVLGITASDIVRRTAIPGERARAIVAGASVAASELRALARGLKLPMKAFSSGGVAASAEALVPMFRSTGATPSEREPTVERLARFVDFSLSVLPKRSEIPQWLTKFRLPTGESFAEAERLSHQFRELVYPNALDDPAADLPQKLDSLDGVILSFLSQSKYEGASLVAGGYVFMFVSPRFPARMLFTLAHELGHIVAHHSTKVAHLDLASSIGRFRNRIEGFADAFASTLLLPTMGVGRTLGAIRKQIGATSDQLGDVELLLLARYYGVSFQVAARRCEDLDLLPRGGAFSLAEYLTKEFGSPEKRAAALKLPPRSQVRFDAISPMLMSYVHDGIMSGDISPSWVSGQLNTSIENIFSSHAALSASRAVAH